MKLLMSMKDRVKPISCPVKCPACLVKHFWTRRQAIAYDEGKSVYMTCQACYTRYWVQKQGFSYVVTKERD